MRRVFWAFGLAFFIAISQIAIAQTAGYDNGFFIRNDEGSFKVGFNARVQPKLEYTKQTIDPKSVISFSLRRAEFGFSAAVEDKLTFNVSMKHATNSDTNNFNVMNISGATGTYAPMKEFRVTAGMVGIPVSIMSVTSTTWLLLVEPPMTELQDDGVQNFTIARKAFNAPDGLGIQVAGDISKFFYSANLVNGASKKYDSTGKLVSDSESNYAFNPGKKFSGGVRVGVNILDAVPDSMTDFDCSNKPKLTVSAGTMYQGQRTDPNTNADIKYMWTSTAGAAFRWGGFAFTTEGYYRRTKVTNPGTAVWSRPKLTDVGYYGAAGYYIIPKKFEIAAQAAQIFRQGPDNNANSFGGGLNYYAINNNLKLQFSYTWTQDYDAVWGTGNDNHIHNFALMASAAF